MIFLRVTEIPDWYFSEKSYAQPSQNRERVCLARQFLCRWRGERGWPNWTMGAYGTDYLEKNWPSSYGGRGGTYPGEGEKKTADNKDGFLWDYCNRYGISFRTYGEFVSDTFTANIPVLTDHICPNYTGFELSIRDTSRFYMWKKDFESLLAAGKAPRLSTIRFANDHTEGLRVGKPTPKAHNADNDLACGLSLNTSANRRSGTKASLSFWKTMPRMDLTMLMPTVRPPMSQEDL